MNEVRAIWKYSLNPDWNEIDMPAQAKPIAVAVQCGTPILYMYVDPSAPVVTRRIACVGTGLTLPSELSLNDYIGTCMLINSYFVLHVFDGGEVD